VVGWDDVIKLIVEGSVDVHEELVSFAALKEEGNILLSFASMMSFPERCPCCSNATRCVRFKWILNPRSLLAMYLHKLHL
jgi:hypothetical protein